MEDDFGLGPSFSRENKDGQSQKKIQKHPTSKIDDQWYKLNSRIDNVEASINEVRNITREILSLMRELRTVMPRIATTGPDNNLKRIMK